MPRKLKAIFGLGAGRQNRGKIPDDNDMNEGAPFDPNKDYAVEYFNSKAPTSGKHNWTRGGHETKVIETVSKFELDLEDGKVANFVEGDKRNVADDIVSTGSSRVSPRSRGTFDDTISGETDQQQHAVIEVHNDDVLPKLVSKPGSSQSIDAMKPPSNSTPVDDYESIAQSTSPYISVIDDVKGSVSEMIPKHINIDDKVHNMSFHEKQTTTPDLQHGEINLNKVENVKHGDSSKGAYHITSIDLRGNTSKILKSGAIHSASSNSVIASTSNYQGQQSIPDQPPKGPKEASEREISNSLQGPSVKDKMDTVVDMSSKNSFGNSNPNDEVNIKSEMQRLMLEMLTTENTVPDNGSVNKNINNSNNIMDTFDEDISVPKASAITVNSSSVSDISGDCVPRERDLGRRLEGSPHKVEIIDTKNVQVSGAGLQSVACGRPAFFKIDTHGAGPGD
ncbi:unnamed protein product, partial [Owenia fusiformis]